MGHEHGDDRQIDVAKKRDGQSLWFAAGLLCRVPVNMFDEVERSTETRRGLAPGRSVAEARLRRKAGECFNPGSARPSRRLTWHPRRPRDGLFQSSQPERVTWKTTRKIIGYRDLTQEEIDLMNEGRPSLCGAGTSSISWNRWKIPTSDAWRLERPTCNKGSCGPFAE